MHQVAAIRSLALRVRKAIEVIPPAARPPEMFSFPSGACGATSLLLGAILADNGFTAFLYVCGERPSEDGARTVSHAWLADGNLIVDITADQFADSPEPVIVSVASSWHKSFDLEHTEPADFRTTLGSGTYPLLAMFAKLQRTLNQVVGTRVDG